MRIGVVSDTHLPRFGRSLPDALVAGWREAGVERLIHCGDWTDPFVVDLLEAVAPVDGVAGNNDPPAITARFGDAPVLELDGARIGVTHSHVGPTHLTTPERARLAFAHQSDLAAICFGPTIFSRRRPAIMDSAMTPQPIKESPVFARRVVFIASELESGAAAGPFPR